MTADAPSPTSGRVALVGAGPGDPGLLTRRGEELLRGADAVVHDRLAHPALLDLAPAEAERIYVGKVGGGRSTPQEEIEAILVRLAREGKRVVRLKGGDPFVFGRGGEEALTLREAGIPFEVVPGVTAGVAVPAYAGIPVTHRAMAVGVTFFTGHEDPTKDDSQLDLSSLRAPGTTGVFYMGRRSLPRIVETLRGLGREAATPVAVTSWGTHPSQRTVVGTLETIVEDVETAGIGAPCIIVVGEVVGLRERLSWFEGRPLFGRVIAVTRARTQASGLVARLRDLGAEVIEAPTLRIEPPSDPEPLRRAVEDLSGVDWVLFTSTNSVERFMDALAGAGGDARRLSGCRLGAIGPTTAAALRGRGLVADAVAERVQSEGLLEALEGRVEPGHRVLLPRAEEARELLPETLREQGCRVDVVPAYRTACAVPEGGARERLRAGEVEVVTFTSSSTVRNFHEALAPDVPAGYRVACIGPVTARTAEELGYTVDLVAEEATIDGLVEALVRELAGGRA